MKKIILSIGVVFALAAYSIFGKKSETNSFTQSSPTPLTSSSNSTTESFSGTNNTGSGLYKDGEYTGSAADAFYGNIQVKAVIQNGKLTDVVFLQYPNDHRESIQINTRAMPLLKQEAITAQSADVDGVSRATDTSRAFIESLTSALNKAK